MSLSLIRNFCIVLVLSTLGYLEAVSANPASPKPTTPNALQAALEQPKDSTAFGIKISELEQQQKEIVTQLNATRETLLRHDGAFSSADRTISTGGSIVTWSGTVIALVAFGAIGFNYLHTKSTKDTASRIMSELIAVKDQIQADFSTKAKELEEAKKIFESFVKSPQAIQSALDGMNEQAVRRALESDDLNHIQRVLGTIGSIIQGESTRRAIAMSAKQFLFPPHNPDWTQFGTIYDFIKHSVSSPELYKIIRNLVVECNCTSLREAKAETSLVTDMLLMDPLPIDFRDVLSKIHADEVRELVLIRGLSKFSKSQQDEVLQFLLESTEARLDLTMLSGNPEDLQILTNFVAERIDKISEDQFSRVAYTVELDQRIVDWRVRNAADVENDKFLRHCASRLAGFELILNSIDTDSEEHWKGIFGLLFYLKLNHEDDYFDLIRKKISSSQMPAGKFYMEVLPALAVKNFGLMVSPDGGAIVFMSAPVSQLLSGRIAGRQTVRHPILGLDIFLKDIQSGNA